MPDHPISSSAGLQPKHRGRPRKFASDRARKLAWWRKEHQKGTSPMQDAPQDVYHELYCPSCCLRQEVTKSDGQQYRCTLCRNIVTPPTDLAACPRSPSGRHNYWRGACSQCGVEMEAPVGADTYYVGSPR